MPAYHYRPCEMCGEGYMVDVYEDPAPHEEVGEFVTAEGESVIGHASCGLERGLELA